MDLEIIRWGASAFTTDGRLPKNAPETFKNFVDAALENMGTAKVDVAVTRTNEYLPELK